MRSKKPKLTLHGTSAQLILKSARIENGKLLVNDKTGVTYAAQRSSADALLLVDIACGWSAALVMDDWCKAELAWWESQLDALTPAQTVYVLIGESGVVVGHLLDPELSAFPAAAYPFRVNNAARRPLPALGEKYTPVPAPVRPRRTRGASVI